MSQIEVRIPDIGDFEEVEVIEVLVSSGDRVEVEDSLISIESDKATMEIPSPVAGVIHSLSVTLGDKVSEGTVVCVVETEKGESPAVDDVPKQSPAEASPAPAALTEPRSPAIEAPARAPDPMPSGVDAAPSAAAESTASHASPMVRRQARELGVDLATARGSGPHGRILEEDVKGYVREALRGGSGGAIIADSSSPPVDFSRFGPIEEVERSRIRKVAGRNLQRSWQQIPHVTHHERADITELEVFRRDHLEEAEGRGFKLTLLPFLMKACVQALRVYPDFGSSLSPDGERLVRKHYFHIGVAVDTEQGLVVPVLRDVDRKGLYELSAELRDVSDRARARKLAPSDLEGACFTISSLGGIGGTAFTPIINPPEVAILGVSRSNREPVWNEQAAAGEGSFEPRLILPLSLSYDHRVIDGAAAARFSARVALGLSSIANLLL